MLKIHRSLWLVALAGAAVTAHAATPTVNVSVEGEVAPGVYGRVDIGNRPPPVLVYSQPVVIAQPARPLPRQPIYLHVPPGHAKNWSKHCAKYNACAQPVYFVRSSEYNLVQVAQPVQLGSGPGYQGPQGGMGKGHDRDKGHKGHKGGKDHGKEHGKGGKHGG